ncbi:hypothetical protein BH18THE2_BH18THE2_14540 [soil metagenome]
MLYVMQRQILILWEKNNSSFVFQVGRTIYDIIVTGFDASNPADVMVFSKKE